MQDIWICMNHTSSNLIPKSPFQVVWEGNSSSDEFHPPALEIFGVGSETIVDHVWKKDIQIVSTSK